MAQKTPNYNLNKPGYEDFGDVDALNENFEKIDEALAAADPTKVATKAAPADGDGVMVADSADGGKAKRLLWSSIKMALGKLFVPLMRKINGKALSADITVTADAIPLTASDSTTVNNAVKWRTNPNMLDNWYFGRPVNQRGGYYAPAGTSYFAHANGIETAAGTLSSATKATKYNDGWYNIVIEGTTYWVPANAIVSGYCAAGYTVDRWFSVTSTKTVQVASDHLTISDSADYGGFIQRLEYAGLLGKTLTFSVLARRTAQGTQSPYITAMIGSDSYIGYSTIEAGDDYKLSTITVDIPDTTPSEGYFFVDIVGMSGSTIEILAAKLELGDTQTLAHQENGVWVLNEMPDYGEQLARCQRSAIKIGKDTAGDSTLIGYALCTSSTLASAFISLPVSMRTKPSVTFKNIYLSLANSVVAVTNITVYESTQNGIYCALSVAGGLTVGQTVAIRTSDGGYIMPSADL